MSLRDRIAAGLADPISDRERQQLEDIRQVGIRRFGVDLGAEPQPLSWKEAGKILRAEQKANRTVHIFHKWSRWVPISNHTVDIIGRHDRVIDTENYTMTVKKCETCGKIKSNRVDGVHLATTKDRL